MVFDDTMVFVAQMVKMLLQKTESDANTLLHGKQYWFNINHVRLFVFVDVETLHQILNRTLIKIRSWTLQFL